MSHTHANPDVAGMLHHVELCASDLDASVSFWDWLLSELGYEPKHEREDGRSWLNEPTYIVLKRATNDEHPFDRNAPG